MELVLPKQHATLTMPVWHRSLEEVPSACMAQTTRPATGAAKASMREASERTQARNLSSTICAGHDGRSNEDANKASGEESTPQTV